MNNFIFDNEDEVALSQNNGCSATAGLSQEPEESQLGILGKANAG
jgi:hypothetical protein